MIGAKTHEDARFDRLELPYRLDLADGVIASRMQTVRMNERVAGPG
jgi:AraC family transcriptional regulator